jgi:hypothetical protein
VGGKLLFNVSELSSWIERHRIKPLNVNEVLRAAEQRARRLGGKSDG